MSSNAVLRDALDAHESLYDFAESDKTFAELVEFLEAVEAKHRRRADLKHPKVVAAAAAKPSDTSIAAAVTQHAASSAAAAAANSAATAVAREAAGRSSALRGRVSAVRTNRACV